MSKTLTMDYLNQFHKETAERKMKALANQKRVSAKEASEQSFRMHRELKEANSKK